MTTKQVLSYVALLALVVLVAGFTARTITTGKLGGGDIVEQYPSYFVNGINIGQGYENSIDLTMATGTNQAYWKNNTNNTVYVWRFIGTQTGTASSTLVVNVGTSTTATVTDSATPLTTPQLIDTYTIATSTTGRTFNSWKNAGTNGQYVIPVLPNNYLIATLENPYRQDCSTTTNCESATSTNRGYNLSFQASITY